jgi:hypothetical protein
VESIAAPASDIPFTWGERPILPQKGNRRNPIMPVTFCLVRTPNDLFPYGSMHGRFGKLIVIGGPKVTAASLVDGGDANDPNTVTVAPNESRTLKFESDGAKVTDVRRYTTIERMDGYVQLRPNCGSFKHKKDGPYEVAFEPGNSVVRHLYQGKNSKGEWTGPVVHDGNCLRIYGALSTPEQGILFHEAPNVSWLIGCISPRKLGTKKTALDSKPRTNESYVAMNELFQVLGRERANFFVLDW